MESDLSIGCIVDPVVSAQCLGQEWSQRPTVLDKEQSWWWLGCRPTAVPFGCRPGSVVPLMGQIVSRPLLRPL